MKRQGEPLREGKRRHVRKGELHELLITSCSSSILHRFFITALLMVPACQTVQMPGNDPIGKEENVLLGG